MQPNHGTTPILIALMACGLTACATITTGVDPAARQAGVKTGAQVVLYGSKANIDDTKFYQEGSSEPLKVVMVYNPTFKQAVGNAVRQEIAQVNANNSPTGSASYTKTERWSPAIYLKQKGAHTIHLVRSDGATATIVAKPHVAMSYVIADWLLIAPTLGTSLFIDMATGKWKKFDDIEVDTYFPKVSLQGSR